MPCTQFSVLYRFSVMSVMRQWPKVADNERMIERPEQPRVGTYTPSWADCA